MSNFQTRSLADADPEILATIEKGKSPAGRSYRVDRLENYPQAVMAAQSHNSRTNTRRVIRASAITAAADSNDVVETLALEQVKKLFGADQHGWAANDANQFGFASQSGGVFALLKPGDTILGMSLAMGGHPTHGSPVNMSGKWFNIVSYGLNADEAIDYNEVERPRWRKSRS